MSIYTLPTKPEQIHPVEGDDDNIPNELSKSINSLDSPKKQASPKIPQTIVLSDDNSFSEQKGAQAETGNNIISLEEVIEVNHSNNETHFKNEITITFKDLKYSVHIKNKKNKNQKVSQKEILKGLTGICRPKELTAIMGASGAGKTTLLNILTLRTRNKGKQKLSGNFLANKQKYDMKKFCKFAGYVMQNDILLETMTPRESFQFAANLRLHAPAKQKKKKVDKLIEDLKLERAADTLIGGTFHKGISGGERKRTSIGLELMTDPSVLFLDEPTSGLDSCTASLLIHLLKSLSTTEGKTIIFTIHQPSSDIFFLFDNLMILAKGKLIYQGVTKKAVEYFASFGLKCPDYSNPADYFIQIAHSNNTEDDKKFEVMYEKYEEQIFPQIENEIENLHKKEIVLAHKENSWLTLVAYISKRSFKNLLRNPILLRGRIAQTLFLTFLLCVLYFQVSQDMDETNLASQTNVRIIYDINGGLFFFCISTFMTSVMSVVLTFPSERAVFLKEYGSNMYGVSAYFFGRSSVEIPFIIIFPIFMTSVSYYIIGFNPAASRFFFFMLIAVCVALAGNAMGLLVGSIFSDMRVATALVPVIIIPWMLFTGVYINLSQIHGWLRWIQYTSPFRYALEALFWNQYEGFPIGSNQMEIYGYDLGKWLCFGLLLIIGVAVRIIALICLKLLVSRLE